MRRGIEWDVDVDSEEDLLVSRFYVVESQEIIFFQLRGPSSTSRPGLGFCLMICNELLGLQTHADLRRDLVSSDPIRRFMDVIILSSEMDQKGRGCDGLVLEHSLPYMRKKTVAYGYAGESWSVLIVLILRITWTEPSSEQSLYPKYPTV